MKPPESDRGANRLVELAQEVAGRRGGLGPRDGPPVFFVDRCLGRRDVVRAFASAGFEALAHDEFFSSTCPDEDWLRAVGALDLLILTKDGRIRYKSAEWAAVEAARAAVFVLTSGGGRGVENAAVLVKAAPQMVRLAARLTRPLFARVAPSGAVSVQVGERRGGVKRD